MHGIALMVSYGQNLVPWQNGTSQKRPSSLIMMSLCPTFEGELRPGTVLTLLVNPNPKVAPVYNSYSTRRGKRLVSAILRLGLHHMMLNSQVKQNVLPQFLWITPVNCTPLPQAVFVWNVPALPPIWSLVITNFLVPDWSALWGSVTTFYPHCRAPGLVGVQFSWTSTCSFGSLMVNCPLSTFLFDRTCKV